MLRKHKMMLQTIPASFDLCFFSSENLLQCNHAYIPTYVDLFQNCPIFQSHLPPALIIPSPNPASPRSHPHYRRQNHLLPRAHLLPCLSNSIHHDPAASPFAMRFTPPVRRWHLVAAPNIIQDAQVSNSHRLAVSCINFVARLLFPTLQRVLSVIE